uniref:Reverse transcriptase domain-containing protein n=1 Tax=Cajanus cajan TaxID=3821 RepID=A0A151RI16_CAJCA|nr:hypothetical protein KK1_036465 [Cajanus cajan]
MVEEVYEIKEVVRSYFEEHFKAKSWLRPRLSLVDFLVLSNAQNERLVGDFTEEEVSCLIRESDGEKSPGPRGLKQGDPLAPSLFLIVVECLRLLMTRDLDMNLFTGLHLEGESPPISLLQFAVDTLIIGEATIKNLWCLKAILRCFELI